MPADVLIVSLGSTAGLRAADAELAAALRRAGARVEVVAAAAPREVRTFALTDLGWARAARAAAREGLARHEPRAILYSTITAALLWPRPGAIRFDAPAAANRPGRHGLWQRPLERRRLRTAPLLVPQAQGALDEAPPTPAPAVIVPIPVEPTRLGGQSPQSQMRLEGRTLPTELNNRRDIDAITYARNPGKKGLDRVLAAWAAARREGEVLVVAGVSEAQARAAAGGALPAGVDVRDLLAPEEYRALLARARVYVTAPRREDYGLAQLEALADGCALVTTPAPGPYAALPIARALDARLVPDAPRGLADAIRTALDDPAPDYGVRALAALAPYRRAAVDRVVAEELWPALLSPPRGRAS